MAGSGKTPGHRWWIMPRRNKDRHEPFRIKAQFLFSHVSARYSSYAPTVPFWSSYPVEGRRTDRADVERLPAQQNTKCKVGQPHDANTRSRLRNFTPRTHGTCWQKGDLLVLFWWQPKLAFWYC